MGAGAFLRAARRWVPALAAPLLLAFAQPGPAPARTPTVHLVWMGGNDCPPCVAWRQAELPKLQKSPEFGFITFSYVTKSIRSSVPAGAFLPAEVRPYKDKLDHASSGRGGSPQAAILVDGEVFDYFHGTRPAHEIEQMLQAIRTGGLYPYRRCVKVSRQWQQCEVQGG